MIDIKRILQIKDSDSLVTFLRAPASAGGLGWPVDPEFPFYAEPDISEGVKGDARVKVSSLVPVGLSEERLVILAEFEAAYHRRDLRQLLRSLKTEIRNSGRWVSYSGLGDTIFIVAQPDWSDVRFVLFRQAEAGQPEIRSFGWAGASSPGRTVLDVNLPRLAWDFRGQWEKAFDVEGLTERFYDEFERVFYRFKAQVKSAEVTSDDQKQAFCQLWFNRLLLLAFVERRKWLIAPGGRTDYLRAQWERHKGLSSYLDVGFPPHLMPNSFASVLGRTFTYLDSDTEMRRMLADYTSIIGEVPYLNGGLFHADETEGYGFEIPDEAFEDIFGDDGLFTRFNFTVTESTPLDQVVEIDPEMLGRVFERLVNDRHKEGKYYTPRSIVSFMVDEALKAYLIEKGVAVQKAELLINEEAIRNESTGVHLDGDELADIRELLTTLRAADPACGSGAYLLGLLQKLFSLGYVLEWKAVVKNLLPLERGRFLYRKKLEIVQNCIYGVDLDPTAVSIARLRLWLSLAIENVEGEQPRPLPYLDFKVVQGDSLVYPLATSAQVTSETELFHQFSEARNDAESTDETLSDIFRAQRRDEAIQLGKDIQSYVDVYGHRAFPWPIIFEEVFGSRPGYSPGFDMVIANPPYVNSGELLRSVGKSYKDGLIRAYPNAGSGTADLLVFFFERALQLLRPGGQLAFITSNKWLKSGYGGKLRAHFATAATVRDLIDYGDNEVFRRVIAYPLVTLASKKQTSRVSQATRFTKVPAFPVPDLIPRPESLVVRGHLLGSGALGSDGTWRLEAAGDDRISRMRDRGIPLGEYVSGRIYRGVLTGLNEVKISNDGRVFGKAVPSGARVVRKEGVFVIDRAKRDELIAEDKSSDDIIKPLAVGRDIQRWTIDDRDRWIIFTRRGIAIENYPAIHRHLMRFRHRLEPKPANWDQASYGDWPGRKAGAYKWYEIQDEIAYFREFDRPKALYQEIAGTAGFAWGRPGLFVNNKVFMIPDASYYLLAILNSRAAWDFWRAISVTMVGGALAMQSPTVYQLPIPVASAEVCLEIEALVGQILVKTGNGKDSDVSHLEAEIDRIVDKLYGLEMPAS